MGEEELHVIIILGLTTMHVHRYDSSFSDNNIRGY
jgi:hypothetical protein